MNAKKQISRREFLKLSALTAGGLALGGSKSIRRMGRWLPFQQDLNPDFPISQPLGRICVGAPGTHLDIKSEPYWDAPNVGTAWFDDVFVWKREVIAKQLQPGWLNQRWVETPEGYIYAESVQKVFNEPQNSLNELPVTPSGERGMWVEITAPFVDLNLTKPKEYYQYWIREVIRPRIYYSQVFWAFDIRQDPESGKTQYCLMQLHGAFEDNYWVNAEVCRRITPDEVGMIHPEVPDKHIVVDLDYQYMMCYEGDREVYFAKVTTGWYVGEKWQTPLGTHTIWEKRLSTHMSAGPAVGNYDIPGIPWTTLFDINGAAIHSTFWHNYFGKPMSHGCVNTRPEDAKWVWRWTEPAVPYYPGKVTIQGLNQSTQVEVRKA